MNWKAIQDAIEQRVAAMTGLSTEGSIMWEGEAEESGFQPTDMRIVLAIRDHVSVGVDEQRAAAPVGNANQVITYCGQRKFTLRVRIESFNQDAGARTTADKIRTRLRSDATRAALNAVGVSVGEVLDTTDVEYQQDDRRVAAVLMGISMNAVENDTETDETAGGYIASTEITGSVGGQTVDASTP